MKLSNANIAGADQFLHEIQGWERALDYYLQENAFLKMRLSQVLDYNTDNNFTPLAEHFQTSFPNRMLNSFLILAKFFSRRFISI